MFCLRLPVGPGPWVPASHMCTRSSAPPAAQPASARRSGLRGSRPRTCARAHPRGPPPNPTALEGLHSRAPGATPAAEPWTSADGPAMSPDDLASSMTQLSIAEEGAANEQGGWWWFGRRFWWWEQMYGS